MMIRSLLALSVTALLAACSPAADTTETAPEATPPVEATPPAAPVNAEAAVPAAGANYWTARQALIAAGFEPVITADSEPWTVCSTAMAEEREITLDQCPGERVVLPEVEACAGTGMGNCRTNWRAPDGRSLIIFTVDGPQPGVVSEVEWAAQAGEAN